MYGAVIEFEIKKDRIDEFKKLWESAVAKALQGGLLNAYLLTNAETGKCRHIGFWRSAEGIKSWPSTQQYQEFLTSIQGLLVSPPRRDIFDVSGDTAGILSGKKVA